MFVQVRESGRWLHRPSGQGALRWAGSAIVVLLALSACKKEESATGPAANGAAAPQVIAPPAQAVSAEVAAMSADQLRDAAGKALTEQRLYAPAANNAMEYYLALRDKQPSDAAVASALTDLMPYALIATEQSIARDDFVEAQRLYALMEKADKQAPALPRLKQSIATAQASLAQRTAAAQAQTVEEADKQKKLEADRLVQQQQAQQEAAQQLAAQQLAAQQAADQQAATQRAADQRAADQRAAEQRAAQAAAPTTAPATQPPAAGGTTPATSAPATASSELRAVSTPSPAYPPEALRAGQSGEVQVEFTVGADGSVSNARVVRSNPPRVFDRAAVAAVRRWRFQPVSAPVTTRRTIGFNPGN
ncbi:MAG: energy transducer TonB [Luteimonas sp.]